jgi:3-polyprenyl-4-hydroxybenzoate decarboxylase
MNYIGVDCHISSLDFAVVNERRVTTQQAKVNTGVKEFIGFVKDVPNPRRIFIEEGELAAMADYTYDHKNVAASLASGSFLTRGMVVVPCTIKTLSGIANSYT